MPRNNSIPQPISAGSSALCIGPLTQQLKTGALWQDAEVFPGLQSWADDIERVLVYLKQENRLSATLQAIRKAETPKQRDALLAEARSAFYLSNYGFRVLEWEPLGEGTRRGDMLVSFGALPPIFTEVKNPSWRADRMPLQLAERNRLSPDEKQRRFARIKQPKFIPGKGEAAEAVRSHITAMDVVRRNALGKLTDTCPNLVIVLDDFFMSPVGIPGLIEYVTQEYLYPSRDPDDPEDRHSYNRLGGVLFLRPEIPYTGPVDYKLDFVENRFVLPQCALPPKVRELFSKLRNETAEREAQRYSARRSSPNTMDKTPRLW